MLKTLTLFALLLATLVLLYAFIVEPNRITVERITIGSNQLQTSSRPLKIIQLSDLHMKTFGPFQRRMANRVNNLEPDYIFITGDFCKHSRLYENPHSKTFKAQMQAIVGFANALSPKKGIYAIRGNNDFSDNKESSDILLQKLTDAGVTVLANRKQELFFENDSLFLIGLDFPDFYHEVMTEFYVDKKRNNSLLVSRASAKNSYSHYYPKETAVFRNYTFVGRMMQSSEKGGIGVTFYSHMHHGYDRYYRLRSHPKIPDFHLSPHGTRIERGVLHSGLVPQPNKWYCFKIGVNTRSHSTDIVAKIWPQDAIEPLEWQIQARDSSVSRLTHGTVGVWSAKSGMHYFDDLIVYTENDTLSSNDFEDVDPGKDPYQWIDKNHEQQILPFLTDSIKADRFTILLAHSPDIVLKCRDLPVDLILSGHTHGGQIRFPLLGALYTQTALGPAFSQGLFKYHNKLLYINRGIGTILIPARFLCPPEITLITVMKSELPLKTEDQELKTIKK